MVDTSGLGQTLVTGSLGLAAPTSMMGLPQATDFSLQCTHFWVIETPNGPTSQGICKICGVMQEFRNSVTSSAWNKAATK